MSNVHYLKFRLQISLTVRTGLSRRLRAPACNSTDKAKIVHFLRLSASACNSAVVYHGNTVKTPMKDHVNERPPIFLDHFFWVKYFLSHSMSMNRSPAPPPPPLIPLLLSIKRGLYRGVSLCN